MSLPAAATGLQFVIGRLQDTGEQVQAGQLGRCLQAHNRLVDVITELHHRFTSTAGRSPGPDNGPGLQAMLGRMLSGYPRPAPFPFRDPDPEAPRIGVPGRWREIEDLAGQLRHWQPADPRQAVAGLRFVTDVAAALPDLSLGLSESVRSQANTKEAQALTEPDRTGMREVARYAVDELDRPPRPGRIDPIRIQHITDLPAAVEHLGRMLQSAETLQPRHLASTAASIGAAAQEIARRYRSSSPQKAARLYGNGALLAGLGEWRNLLGTTRTPPGGSAIVFQAKEIRRFAFQHARSDLPDDPATYRALAQSLPGLAEQMLKTVERETENRRWLQPTPDGGAWDPHPISTPPQRLVELLQAVANDKAFNTTGRHTASRLVLTDVPAVGESLAAAGDTPAPRHRAEPPKPPAQRSAERPSARAGSTG